MSDLPEPWATWASRVGARPSMTGIGERAGVPASTVSRLIRGRTTDATVAAVAGALRVSPREVLAAAKGESFGPWQPPIESHLLHDDERDALRLLIQRMTAGREGGSSASTDVPPKKSGGGGRPRSLSDYKRQRLDDAAQLQQDAADHPDDDPR